MPFFRRRPKPPKVSKYMVFATNESLQEWERGLADAGLTQVGTSRQSQGTYETWNGSDAEKAKAWLRERKIDQELYYVVVQTPDGVWGADIEGLYLEKLRPWQLDLASAETTAEIVTLINGVYGIELAATGRADNFIVEVACGRCERTWLDGVRYRDLTLVRCPHCGAANRVDSADFTVA